MEEGLDRYADKPKPRKFNSEIIDQITHFFKRDDNTQRNTLQIELEHPKMVKGYPKDGTITIRLLKESGSVAFKLNTQEAVHVAEILKMAARDNITVTHNLWKSRNQE